jgi:hypothetical protein
VNGHGGGVIARGAQRPMALLDPAWGELHCCGDGVGAQAGGVGFRFGLTTVGDGAGVAVDGLAAVTQRGAGSPTSRWWCARSRHGRPGEGEVWPPRLQPAP